MKIKYTTPFTMIENKIIRHKELTIYQKMTFIALCSYANDKNICFPSYETIAGVVGCSRRKVIDIIKELVALGLIIKHKNTAPNGDATANEYEIVAGGEFDAPPNAPPAPQSSEQDALPGECPAPKQYINNNINISFNNNHLSADETQELDEILENSGIDGLNKEQDRDLFRQAITTMYQSKEIIVCGNTYPQSVVRKNLRKLNYEVIVHAFDTLKAMDFPPKSPINYLVSVLYRGIFEAVVN